MEAFPEKYLKFLKLEQQRNYDNRAIFGGLEKISDVWQKDAQIHQVKPEIGEEIYYLFSNYSKLNQKERKASIEKIRSLIAIIGSTQFTEIKTEPSVISINRQSTPSNYLLHEKKITTQNIGLNSPLTVIRGIGERTAKILGKLNLQTLNDLLHYYPRRYDDFSQLKPINGIDFGEEITIMATVDSIQQRQVKSGRYKIIEAFINDGTGKMQITWFNQPWVLKQIIPGKQFVFSGKVDIFAGRYVMTNPDFETLDREHLHTNRIVPIYPLTAGITQKWLRRIMHETISYWTQKISDYLPEEIKKSENIGDLPYSLMQIHFPDNNDALEKARERLSFDEIFFLQLGVLIQKRNWAINPANKFAMDDQILQKQINLLPFKLTDAQMNSFIEIRKDLNSGKQMNRLLQGDVGAGKTVVARLAIEIVIRHGAQAAIMAPTSILAQQHFQNFKNMLLDSEGRNVILKNDEIALLIGDTPEKEKEQIRQKLESGGIKLIIGTHALIEEPINFKWLQLVVIDEQHRFGVAQRALLRSKGDNPHLLIMSATPIPRSLALTIYGDLDLSIIDEMPSGRLSIETHLLSPNERGRAYKLIESQINKGNQAFIIYPLVEGDEEQMRNAAVNEYHRLKESIFPQMKIGLIHGRLRQNEKDAIMQKFRENKLNILVSTSVIEVGLDIPNATVVLIEGANRFGLAQLHQIRGRVGRGREKSYCLLIPDIESNYENERLSAMIETNDGFKLAEYDLKQRGPGDFLGTRQSGFLGLKLASLSELSLIERARIQAQKIFDQDPLFKMPEHTRLLDELKIHWPTGFGDLS